MVGIPLAIGASINIFLVGALPAYTRCRGGPEDNFLFLWMIRRCFLWFLPCIQSSGYEN